ncbi:MAG: hypothetical protein VX379_07550, partial [Pseudomonadota bacterium]|nr:hypothetical protein [Pseudomonadota bacterium]MEE3321991.1 hypothetical protein [Pseudomonadota bacterium]
MESGLGFELWDGFLESLPRLGSDRSGKLSSYAGYSECFIDAKRPARFTGGPFCIRHQASGIRHQASGIRHQASGIRHQASGIRHQASGIR